mmetsp:Transcript_20043/g.55732  ORF Transcript_20043/g.55732 Transcript_20043/m.55732 type:complete len:336 (+) Transcript_20043:1469-2476(+)
MRSACKRFASRTSSFSLTSFSSSARPRSASHLALSGATASVRLEISCRSSFSRFLELLSFSRLSAVASISSWSIRRSSWSICSGRLSSAVRLVAAASSIRSMLLSGLNRLVMYLLDNSAAATSEASAMRTPWCASYRPTRPRSIDTVFSTLGSRTVTFWNRRSKAESFSMCFRYSSLVVAPIMRSSPRASMGLSRFAASIAPSVLPAPSTRWISSTKTTIFPSALLTSSRTARSRSSNSPRYLAPATRAPKSKVRRLTPLRVSGTSPSRMRLASPSTTAVFPVPGSPTRTGLFLVRRDKICTTLRISSSRPITGSSRPSSADFTRSMPYFCKASY